MIKIHENGTFKILLDEDLGEFVLYQGKEWINRYSTLLGAKDAMKRRASVDKKTNKCPPYPILNYEGKEGKITSLSCSIYGSIYAWITWATKSREKSTLSRIYKDTPEVREAFKKLAELSKQRKEIEEAFQCPTDSELLEYFKIKREDIAEKS